MTINKKLPESEFVAKTLSVLRARQGSHQLRGLSLQPPGDSALYYQNLDSDYLCLVIAVTAGHSPISAIII